MQHLGSTRTTVRANYALLSPDSFIRAPLPGMENATAIVHTAPAMGAAFTQYTAEFEAGGQLGATRLARFLYVLEGELQLDAPDHAVTLARDGFAYIPAGLAHRLKAAGKARVSVIERPYLALAGVAAPQLVIGNERAVQPQPLWGDEKVEVRGLIPADFAFDLAVNTMTYAPGATLPLVECHVMEHGLVMLDGSGIYRLADDWHPTTAGDFIWMGPYCPQWFGALGNTPARYLIYKDWNRHPQPGN